uniref:Dual specificity phosphatase 22 n=1 Tax=Podarcis muralis TaxID=64176 RepID=A0A670I8R2_PODMU
MGNGMNKILPGLFLGNFKDARDTEQLKKNNITHILSIHDSARPMLEGVKYLCIPAADSPSQNLVRHFKESIEFIHECRLGGQSCLVHCLAGVSRSATLVVAYIMTITDLGWEDALSVVRASRSCANPNAGFQRQLEEFEKTELAHLLCEHAASQRAVEKSDSSFSAECWVKCSSPLKIWTQGWINHSAK